MKLNYGDQVIVNNNAPLEYKPGEYGSIYAITTIDEKYFSTYEGKFPIGTVIFSVEYIDGSECDIPEEYLILDIPYESFKDS